MDVLRPEYDTSDEVKLYEMTLKKHRDTDKIPVPIAMFGKYIKAVLINKK